MANYRPKKKGESPLKHDKNANEHESEAAGAGGAPNPSKHLDTTTTEELSSPRSSLSGSQVSNPSSSKSKDPVKDTTQKIELLKQRYSKFATNPLTPKACRTNNRGKSLIAKGGSGKS
ncbi:MAG: hypothetical protein SFT93_05070 [Rickettsiaceae bacterium]|nr:hypothetical protein [Rickettsiaceae bacterium]